MPAAGIAGAGFHSYRSPHIVGRLAFEGEQYSFPLLGMTDVTSCTLRL